MIVFLLSSFVGGAFTYLVDTESVRNYNLPFDSHLLTSRYLDYLFDKESFFGYSIIPYVFLLDLIIIYFHFGFSVGGILWWIPQFCALYILIVVVRFVI